MMMRIVLVGLEHTGIALAGAAAACAVSGAAMVRWPRLAWGLAAVLALACAVVAVTTGAELVRRAATLAFFGALVLGATLGQPGLARRG